MVVARSLTALLMVLGLATPTTEAISRDTEVDLALVLAVDVSFSMTEDEQELQRQGFIEAFRSPEVHKAIRKGMLGRMAVTYFEWSGTEHQQVIVPWTVIELPEDALGVAARLTQRPVRRIGYTSISAAIDFSLQLFNDSGLQAARQAIDISGDGPNNEGRPVTQARDEAVAHGITINGLPIMLNEADAFGSSERLDLYYRDCVIAGQGAFMIPIRERQQFVEAVRNKIIREIAARSAARPLVQQAQSASPRECQVGENQARRRMDN
jgi:hypothetical protein